MRNSRFKSRLPILGSTRSAAGISLERIKLADILKFDFEKQDDLEIIDMFWEVCRLSASFEEESWTLSKQEDDGPAHHEEWEIRLATAYIIISRWFQHYQGPDHGLQWFIEQSIS